MSDSQSPPLFFCLIVEDCDHDYMTLERLLRRSLVQLSVTRCTDGYALMALLDGPDLSTDLSMPAVIVLDLDLPGPCDGRQMLRAIRKHPRLKRTPVVVFSGSTNPRDIDWCHGQGASAYQVKNTSLLSFKCVADWVVQYWSGRQAHRAPLELA